VIECPRCGLQLPNHARFCARCGSPLPGGGRLPGGTATWVIVLFGLGAAAGALVALVYSIIALTPDLPAAGMDPERLRLSAIALAVLGALVFVLQVAALVGLAQGRDWGRVVATVACVGWALTCIGLPVSLAVISSLWGRRSAGT
jgi:hypothetical protein